jgi:hypothetical protein
MITLDTLTAQDITDLLANGGYRTKRAKPKKYGITFDSATNAMHIIANPKAAEKGGFSGKVGSTRRSRKGRTYREPNGKRYYEGLDSIPAYKV